MFKKILGLLLGALLLSTGAAVSAQADSAEAAAERLRLVMIDPDRPKLEALVADELTYGHSGGRLDTKTSFIGDLMNGNSDFVTIDITDQTVKVMKDVTVIHHTLTARTNDRGVAGNVKLLVLQVWQRREGGWRLVARQAVRFPEQAPA